MATYSTYLKLLKPAQGENSPAWAATFNAGATELSDDAIDGLQDINLASSTSYSLAAMTSGADTETRARTLRFTGTPASAVTVTVPASVTSKHYTVINNCGQTLTLKYAATTGRDFANGAIGEVYCDGVTVLQTNALTERTAAEIAAGVTPTNYAYEPNWLLRYGTNTTPGTTDMTAAFQNAVLVSEAGKNEAIFVHEGEYYIAGTVTIRGGVAIIGRGSQGSTEQCGFTILHGGAAVDCLLWNGNGVANQGTGGGLKNCLIIKKTGVTGGNAINLTATDDSHRPGEMEFDNVLIYASGTGQWSKCLYIDGTACNTPGARGVRDIWFNKFRVGGASSNNQYIHIKQVSNMQGQVQMDTANGTGTLGMTIDDIWDHIDLDVRVGNIIVNYTGASNPNLNLRGECDSFDNNHANVIGVQALKCTTALSNASTLVRISSNIADAFMAWVSSTVSNQTGDGTVYTMLPGTEDHDANTGFDTSTGIFTAKCAGPYQFNYQVVFTGLGAAHTTGELFLLHKNSGGSTLHNFDTKAGVGPARDAANQYSLTNSCTVLAAEGDTFRVQVAVSGSTKTVGVGGAATTLYSFFSGKLLA